MKNIHEVIRQTELKIVQLEKEVEGLRILAPMLAGNWHQLEETKIIPPAEPDGICSGKQPELSKGTPKLPSQSR